MKLKLFLKNHPKLDESIDSDEQVQSEKSAKIQSF